MSDSCPQASRDTIYVIDTDTNSADDNNAIITAPISSIDRAIYVQLLVAISKIDNSTLLKTNL